MNFRKIIQDYFTFSRKERNGILLLVLLVLVLAVASQLVFLLNKPGKVDAEQFRREIALFQSEQNVSKNKLFPFDPNQIDSLALDSLNLPFRLKQNLLKYRAKGGFFSEPKDFKRLYGMNDSLFKIVESYVHIRAKRNPNNRSVKRGAEIQFYYFDPNKLSDQDWMRLGLTNKQIVTINHYKHSLGGVFNSKAQFAATYGIQKPLMDSLLKYMQIKPTLEHRGKEPFVSVKMVELNTADTTLLKTLPGIGRVLSSRIVKYRDLLGGFYSLNQLTEVYGLKQETFQKIEARLSVDTLRVKKMNLNFSSFSELSKHPYIDRALARKIIDFRSKYGKIKRTSVLYEQGFVSGEKYEKLFHYLETENL